MYYPGLLVVVICLVGAISEKSNRDYAEFFKRLDIPLCRLTGFVRHRDLIYVLCTNPVLISIRVYDDSYPFDLTMLISLEEIEYPRDLVLSKATECLYVRDALTRCIWKITTDQQILSKFLCLPKRYIKGMSASADGKVALMQSNLTTGVDFVETFNSDAKLIRSINLLGVESTGSSGAMLKAILKPDGGFILVSTTLNYKTMHEPAVWVIRLATANGETTSRHVNLTTNGCTTDKECWFLETDDDRVNDSILKPICFAPCTMAFLLLEEDVIPVIAYEFNVTLPRKNTIILDLRVDFGIRSKRNKLEAFKGYVD